MEAVENKVRHIKFNDPTIGFNKNFKTTSDMVELLMNTVGNAHSAKFIFIYFSDGVTKTTVIEGEIIEATKQYVKVRKGDDVTSYDFVTSERSLFEICIVPYKS